MEEWLQSTTLNYCRVKLKQGLKEESHILKNKAIIIGEVLKVSGEFISFANDIFDELQ
jgi:hypothetical protein